MLQNKKLLLDKNVNFVTFIKKELFILKDVKKFIVGV